MSQSPLMGPIIASYNEMLQHEQDRKDGAALRRLREACRSQPKTIIFDLTFAGGAWYIDTRPPTTMYRGATIAEAADACRAALEGR